MAQKFRKTNKNNYQDKFAEKEFEKGEKYSKQKSRRAGRDKTNKISCPAIIKGIKEGNDISWHNPQQEMFDGATGVTFTQSVGLPLPNSAYGQPGVSNSMHYSLHSVKVPGVMACYFIPSLGKSSDGNSPINTAVTKLFQYIRKNKSGTEIYQPADIGMVIGALDSAYMFYEFMVKIYGMMNDVDLMNTYTPRVLVKSHGVNYESVKSRMADFKFYIDHFAYDLSGFYLPKGIHLIDRHTYMTRGLFTDGDTTKAQYYAFVPSHYLVFSEGISSAPFTTLKYEQLIDLTPWDTDIPASQLVTFEQLVSFGDSLLLPLRNSETVRNITADLVTAFPENGSYSVGLVANDYVLRPTYDKQMLMQLENAFFYGYGNTVTGGYTQVVSINNSYMTETLSLNPGTYHSNEIPTASVYNFWESVQLQKYMLNFHWDNPSKEDIMYSTRLAGFGFGPTVDEDGTATDAHYLRSHGSEIMTNFAIFEYQYFTENDQYSTLETVSRLYNTYWILPFANINNSADIPVASLQVYYNQLTQVTDLLSLISKFDWHPRILPVTWANIPVGGTVNGFLNVGETFLDIDVFGRITEEQLEQMNIVSLLGLLVCRDIKGF